MNAVDLDDPIPIHCLVNFRRRVSRLTGNDRCHRSADQARLGIAGAAAVIDDVLVILDLADAQDRLPGALPPVNPGAHFGCNVPHQGRIAPPDDVGIADEVVGQIIDSNMRGVNVVIPRVGP